MRRLGTATIKGQDGETELWLFWLAPIIGAALAGFAYSWISVGDEEPVVVLEHFHRVVVGARHGQVGEAVTVKVGRDYRKAQGPG